MARVEVTEFTDPYCTWCWGAEPVVRRLRETYRDQLAVSYVMGGLAEDYEQFTDPAGSAATDGEVAPHWQAAAQQHGMPVDVSLWHDDPPGSTYPACVAYEAATFQDEGLADRFLRRMREAGAAEAANLEREAVLGELARDVGLDVQQFLAEFDSHAAWQAFEDDRATAREHGATSFPTFLVEFDGGRELLRGYKPFPAFEKLFAEADLALTTHDSRPIPALLGTYGRMATEEVAEIRELSRETARSELIDLTQRGVVEAVEAGSDYFWEPA